MKNCEFHTNRKDPEMCIICLVEELLLHYLICDKLQKENKELRQRIKELGEKYSKATEFFDEFIENDFVEIPPMAKEFVNQIGNEVLQILEN